LESGKSKSEVADLVGVHKCTIGRELNRNIGKRGQNARVYVPRLAQNKTTLRHKIKHKSVKFTDQLKHQAANWVINKQLSSELNHILKKILKLFFIVIRYYSSKLDSMLIHKKIDAARKLINK